uniref:TPR_REGION domain-containing protein n=1 Tax=Panagrellus redivivus TaxID=6233 RepID=A0A7E4V825_PANRE
MQREAESSIIELNSVRYLRALEMEAGNREVLRLEAMMKALHNEESKLYQEAVEIAKESWSISRWCQPLDKMKDEVPKVDVYLKHGLLDRACKVLLGCPPTTEPELLWRLARVLAEKAKLTKDKNEKKTLFLEALEYAQKALSNEPVSGCFGAHKCTYEEALRHFERAETLQPGFYKANAYSLGEVLEKLGRKAEALEFYKKAFTGPIISVDDRESHEKALAKLKKNGIDEKALVAGN